MAIALVSILVGAPATRGDAAGTRAGDALVINPATNKELTGGGSKQPFVVEVPDQGACRGSSSRNGYFVSSFITSAANDPTTLSFDADGPHTRTGVAFPLFDATHSSYVERNTDQPRSGSTEGAVLPTGSLTWTDFDTSALPPGSYRVGLACIASGNATRVVDRYWDRAVSFTADASDPSGFVWKVDGPAHGAQAAPARSDQSSRSVRMLAVGAVLVLGLVVVVFRRRLRGPRPAHGAPA
jgi:hypothetical protein